MTHNLITCPGDGKMQIVLHPGQRRAWDSAKRFVTVLAGTQLGRQQGRAPDQGYRGKGGIDQEAQGGQAQRRDYRPPSGINPPDVLRGAETTSRTMLKVLPACVASTQRKKTSNLGLLAPRYPSHTYTYKEISFISFEELDLPPPTPPRIRPANRQENT